MAKVIPHDRDAQGAHRSRGLPPRVRDTFAQALLREGWVTQDVMHAAMAQSTQDGLPLHEVLMTRHDVDERVLFKALADAAGVPLLDAEELTPTPLAFRLVPERVVRRHNLLPVSVEGRTVTYAMDRLYDEAADRDVSFTTGRKTAVALACPSELQAAISRSYPFRSEIDSLVAKAQTKGVVGVVEEVKLDVVTDSAVVDLCNMLLARAVDAGASDMHLDPDQQGILVRLRIGGVLEPAKSLPGEVAGPVRNRFKILAGTDISVRHRPQDGGFSVTLSGRRIDVRLSTLPTTHGEKLVMRVIDSHSQLQALETLGYDEELLVRFKRVLERPDGLILVTGPTGSGKTTALYAALNYLHNGRVNVVSVEDPVERTIPGVNQIPVNVRAGNTFASVLRAVLRQDPNVLMVEAYAVIEARTGREAVALAEQHSPDLIVMDLNMPELDGYGAIAELRADNRFAGTPIVVVTAEEGPRVQEHVITLGADDYIVKPFEPQVLTSRIKAAFERHQMAA